MGLSRHLTEHHAKETTKRYKKQFGLDLRKGVADGHKSGERRYTKSSTAVPSVKKWSEKYEQENEREPQNRGQVWQR